MQLIGELFYSFSLAILGIESLTYTGFIEKHTYVSIWFLLAIIAIFSKVIPLEKINKQIKNWVLYISISGWLFLSIAECVAYPNFVYSRFHVNLESTSLFIGLLIWPRLMRCCGKQSIFVIIACFISLLYITTALQKTVIDGIKKNKSEITNLDKTYDEKMAEEYGPSYYYYKFVVENTPENSTIVVPPQMAPWIRTGNVGLSRYFLETRHLANGAIDSIPDINADYIMISSEKVNDFSDYRLWPSFNIKAEKVISFDPKTKTVKEETSYDPYYFSANKLWGLIKIEK